jgi:4'-phosphopantetheinyl transferase
MWSGMMQDARPIVLDECKVALFSAAVSTSADVTAALFELLDDDERRTAARLVLDKDQHLFVLAHALLRYGLWRVTAAANWRFRVDRFGKRELETPFGDPALRFSLSHSDTLAACAISVGHDVGVDLEAVDHQFEFDEIAATHFASHERAQLAARVGTRRVDAFYQLWTLREAVAKAIGHGLAVDLPHFVFTLEPLSLAISADHAHRWHIEQRWLEPRHWASLAVHHPPQMTISVEWRSVKTSEILAALGQCG